MNLLRPLGSSTWWKKHWYVLVIIFLTVLVFILSSKGSGNISNFVKKVKDIKEKSGERILDLEIEYERNKLEREKKLEKEKEKIKIEAAKKLEKKKKEIRKKCQSQWGILIILVAQRKDYLEMLLDFSKIFHWTIEMRISCNI